MVKLSKRLQHIESIIPNHYQHIWDCCCDHGFLGAALLQRQAAPFIHFVDIVPELTSLVQTRLEQFFAHSASQWQVYCQDVKTLPLDKSAGKQLVIIAGVGGDLMIEIIRTLYQQYSHLAIDYLLCPVYQQFNLRQTLVELNMSLKQEHLIEDKGRFYEILYVSHKAPQCSQETIHPIGEQIWQHTDAAQADINKRYLKRTLTHYTRMQQSDPTQAQQPIKWYSHIQHQLNL
ncbi:tRNA (adenine(22)-N(1))-methyltransferase [Vibrio rumoiensis]|uniref:tRNA (adenine(22)-N(1))-methyltransferase n=1 Tax=Vibrio rumoiensis TaxID=76258 RepID=UPI003AA89D02